MFFIASPLAVGGASRRGRGPHSNAWVGEVLQHFGPLET